MQRKHSLRHLAWRGGVAAVSQALMVSGVYPLLPHALRAIGRRREHVRPSRTPGAASGGVRGAKMVRVALAEWGMSIAVSAVRPAGFLPLPGARTRGPRPIILLHGYAMNRANFVPLAYRLARAGLGPIYGFEYWTLGRIAAGARQLGWFVDEVRERTGAGEVDIVGHSMGGVVARYYVTFAGGDGVVRNLITLGSPHGGTDVSGMGVGHPTRELVLGSKLVTRLTAAPAPRHTRTCVIWSRADALVPGARQPPLPGAETILYDDIGHVAMLGSRRVAAAVIERLGR
jgi:triacylglycerol esterase/lipase EstA (alpha/beta hydrolase family)